MSIGMRVRSKTADAVILTGAHLGVCVWLFWLVTEAMPLRDSASPYVTESLADFKSDQPLIDKTMSILPLAVRRSVASVRINDDNDHYASGENADAHCHGNRVVCIKTYVLDNHLSTLWHEAGHAYHKYLNDKGSDFEKRWLSVRPYRQKLELLRQYGFVSDDDYRRFIINFPMLTSF